MGVLSGDSSLGRRNNATEPLGSILAAVRVFRPGLGTSLAGLGTCLTADLSLAGGGSVGGLGIGFGLGSGLGSHFGLAALGLHLLLGAVRLVNLVLTGRHLLAGTSLGLARALLVLVLVLGCWLADLRLPLPLVLTSSSSESEVVLTCLLLLAAAAAAACWLLAGCLLLLAAACCLLLAGIIIQLWTPGCASQGTNRRGPRRAKGL